jgi:hypothetical protein
LDAHTTEYEQFVHTIDFEPFHEEEEEDEIGMSCHYTIDIYPGIVLYEEHHSNKPLILTIGVIGVFALTCLVFFLYDRLVHVRQMKVLDTAQRSNAIVASLFPVEVQKRLMNTSGKLNKKNKQSVSSRVAEGAKFKLKSFLNNESGSDADMEPIEDKPIADLFPKTTVLFADISGFTAWASVREPTQVFIL